MSTIELGNVRVHDAPAIDDLEARDEFVGRHVGPRADDIEAMLRSVGVTSLDALMEQVVPKSIRRARPLRLPAARTEAAVLSSLREIAGENRVLRSFIGMGYSNCHVPSVIL
ncbi:MAG: hypothetical protein ACKVQU_18730, partial [Burkholderiales bacterium]